MKTASDVKAGELLVVIRDSGPGIDPENLDRIFDPFFTTKKPGAGTGLGLAICYSIVQEHGGSINVDSTPESGTEFTVRLPLAPDEYEGEETD